MPNQQIICECRSNEWPFVTFEKHGGSAPEIFGACSQLRLAPSTEARLRTQQVRCAVVSNRTSTGTPGQHSYGPNPNPGRCVSSVIQTLFAILSFNNTTQTAGEWIGWQLLRHPLDG